MSHIFKTWVTPALHAAGFKKRGIVYVRDLGSVQHLFNHESDHLNTADKYSFTTNCGIHVPGVRGTFGNCVEPKAVDAAYGLLNVRPGMLTPTGDSWWELTSSDGPEKDDEVGQELRKLVETAALPFFDRFRDERAVAEFLSQPRRKEDRHVMPFADTFELCYAAILWKRLGCKDKCRECIERERSKTKKRYSSLPEKFLARFSCDDN
ncbi:DUF4304 domain-containing protein [Polyangium jinanense]|uniref:DUF4304 domain-containing protein n=1 Tax=Polyangium jinanense TaxID=2829994 RepID=A0A9X3X1Y5_9BACT|nr:DUF4304 domain-containing protein [Polyangium jinanense]MDC3952332.1 DUF4304 domain-containing protein [Polyangium jinanense]MDC3979961.1 DUF4304 domain-containing protein [Polyangium jinanense]